MHRRQVLATAGTCLPLLVAGCPSNGMAGETPTAGADTDTTFTQTPTPESVLAPGETVSFSDGTRLTVSDPTVQKSVVVDQGPFLTIGREAGVQFVVVDVTGDADRDPSAFVLERNTDVIELPRSQQPVRGVVRDCRGTCIAIPVPAEPIESASVAYYRYSAPPSAPPDTGGSSDAKWKLDDAFLDSLSKVPDLQLHDVSFTEHDDDIALELTVENVGERDGGFRALVAPTWVDDVTEPVGFPVPRGQTVTETVVPQEIQVLAPGEAVFETTPTADARVFRVSPKA